METNTEVDAKKNINNTKIGKSLKCEPSKKRKPLMIVYDAPAKVTEERFMEAAFEQNVSETVQKKDFTDGFQVNSKLAQREKRYRTM